MTDWLNDQGAGQFLTGGGEMAVRIAAADWSATLGPLDAWPQSLKTTVSLLVHSPVPIVLLWGPDGVMLYNDAYSVFAGGRHPQLLGSKVREGWPEVADFNDHVMRIGLAGGTLSYKDQELVLHRSGKPEQVWMNLDYSPVIDESGKPGGVIAIVVETTQRVLAERSAGAQHARLEQMFRNAPSFMAQLDGPAHVFGFTNGAYQQLIGHRNVIGKPIREALPDIEGQGFVELLDQLYASGESFRGHGVSVKLQRTPGLPPEDRLVDFVYQPVRDAAGKVSGIFVEGHDVTESVRAQARNAALAELSSRLRDNDDPEILAYAAAEILGRALNVSRAGYGTIDAGAETITIARDWNAPGIQSLAGVLQFRDYGSYIEELKQGQTVVCTDAETDPRTRDQAAALNAINARSFVNMPVTEQGGFVALLYLNHATARLWTDQELTFIREVAERTRTAIERRRAEAGRKSSEAQFSAMAQTMLNHVWTAQPDGLLDWFNDRVYEYSGAAPGTMNGTGWTSIVHPGDLPAAATQWSRALANGETYQTEFRLRRADGAWHWHLARAAPIKDAAGNVTRWVGTNTDIHERALAEQRSVAEQERQRRLFNQMPGFVGVLNGPDHVYDYVNEAYKAIAGSRELIGRTVRQTFPELAGQGFFELLDRVYDSGERHVAHGMPLRLTGEQDDRFIDFVYEPIRDEHGIVTGIFVGGYDSTETYRAARALRDLNAELERKVIERTQARGRVWQVSPDLMGALNAEAYFETSNPAWQTMLGWSEDEVASMSIFELLHPDDVERTRAGFELTQIGQPAIQFPNRYRRKDGSYRWISWVGVPEEGMVYCSGRDITAEKEKEAELAQTQEALRQAQKMEAVGQLTGGIAHDFNNLLQGITGALDRVQHRIAEGRTGDVERFLKAAIDSANRAASLTHRLLAFSRRQTLDPRPIDTNRLIGGMEELIRRTMGPNVAVEVVGAGGLWPIRADASQLENSLLNLCINARDAMPNGGTLTVETANKWLDAHAARERELPPGQYVSLCVTDTGTGMTPEIIARAFDPFFTTKPMGRGTGLGLSMIYGFVRQSGGQVRVYSEMEKGTTMCLYFPRHQGKIEDESAPGGEMMERGFGETVLVVDDEPTVRMLIAEVLSESFYNIIEAPDGPSALKILETDRRVDLMITDVGLPGGMNGRQVADAARVARKNLKVLFITGYAENAAVGNGHLDPGMEILAKPFAMSTLANKVREMIES